MRRLKHIVMFKGRSLKDDLFFNQRRVQYELIIIGG